MEVKTKSDQCPYCGCESEKFDDASNFEDKKHRYQCDSVNCPVEMFTVQA